LNPAKKHNSPAKPKQETFLEFSAWQGPIPNTEDLEKFEKLHPGATEIFLMNFSFKVHTVEKWKVL